VGVHQNANLLARVFGAIVPPQEGEEGAGGGAGPKPLQLRFRRAPQATSLDVNLFVTYVKFGGEDLLGVQSRKGRLLYERAAAANGPPYEPSTLVEADVKAAMQVRARAAFEGLCRELLATHKARQAAERRAERDRLLHGSLTDEKEKALEEQKKACDKLLANVQVRQGWTC
jgi:hypothetical protein